MPNAYSYLRFSTGDQIHGDSYRRQTELARAWCAKSGIPLVENYRDLGVSAFRGKNADKGALKAFLDQVEAGRIPSGSYLIVESLDRLSRTDITFALQMFLGLINSGIVVVTLADQRAYDREKINDGNFTDLIISLTILSRANEESRMKSSRVSAAWAAKRDRASEEKLTSRCPTWLTLAEDRKSFIPVTERVAVINRIYTMAAAGMGQLVIARTLNRENVPTFRGATRWHISSVKKILDSRSLIGEFQPGKMVEGKRQLLDPVPDYYPTVVPIELFATVQRIRRQRPSFRGRGQSNPIAGIAVNAMTGNKMIRLSKGTDQNYIYLVDAAAPSGAAPYISWRFTDFMSALLVCCQAVTEAPQLPEKEDPELEAAMKRLDEVEAQIPRLVDFIATGFSAAADQKLRTLEKERASLEAKIAVLQAEANAGAVETEGIDWSDTEALKQNIRAVVKQIVVHPAERWFRVELFDGRFVRYAEEGDEVLIESNENVQANQTQRGV
jgi:DNA invertase Pin-like site-specific DNA recombinase